MRIKKLLIVPPDALVEPEYGNPLIGVIARPLKSLKRRFTPASAPYDAEVLFYGDMPFVLGRENTFQFGEYFSHLHFRRVPPSSPYPSCHGTPRATTVNVSQLERVLGGVDAVLISTRAGVRRERVTVLARSRGIPIGLIDFQDHQENYGAIDVRKNLTYNFIEGRDFDLYFKKDLLLGYGTRTIRPIAPVPVRPESFVFPAAKKSFDIFYSGRSRQGCQADRGEMIELVKQRFSNILIQEHDRGRGSFMTTHEYWRDLALARMALSSSGKVWDSLRHCEVGLAPKTVLLAPKPYVETVGPKLVDGENAILYDTEFREGKYHVADLQEVVAKIKHCLADEFLRTRLAETWMRDVREGHTVLARSRYVVGEMERVFSS